MGPMRSPDELVEAAEQHMLGGRKPKTTEDWYRVMNFCAANIDPEVVEPACLLMRRLYDMPIHDDIVREIVKFQQERKP